MKNKVPKLRFPEFSGEWKEKRLGDICNIIMGQSPSSLAYNENLEGLPLVQGNADCKKRKVIPRIYSSEITKESLPKDIIMSVRAPAGTIAKSDIHSCIGRGVCAIRSKIENQEYIYQYLINYEDKWNKYSQGSTFDSINSNDIKGLYISFPSFSEQEKIASFLSKVDESIEILEEEKELWEKYKKGMMQKIFSQKLRFKDENGKDYPEWEEKKLGEVLTIGNGKDYKHLNEGDIPVFGTGGYMTSVDKYLHDGETVFIGRKGTINKPFYYNGKFWTVDTLFYTHNFKNSLPKFIYVIFQNVDWLQYNEASGVPSLSKSTINNIFINLPSLPEQEKIANLLSSIDEKIELIEKELEEFKEFKKGLLQQMFV